MTENFDILDYVDYSDGNTRGKISRFSIRSNVNNHNDNDNNNGYLPHAGKNDHSVVKNVVYSEEMIFLEASWAYELVWALAIMWFLVSALIFVQSRRASSEVKNVGDRRDEMNQKLEHGEIAIDLEFIDVSDSNY